MPNILNENQRIVAETLDDNILLLASAGTGKTNTLAQRILNIIDSDKCLSKEILCITFTNKACTEMKERIEEMCIGRKIEVVIKTFHSFCYDVIKNEAKKMTDIYTDFIIFDEEDCKEIIKTVNYFDFSLGALQNFIGLIKEHRGIYKIYSDNPLQDYKKVIDKIYSEKEDKINSICITEKYSIDYKMKDFLKLEGHKIVQGYNSTLYNNHGLDFADLIVKVQELFKEESIGNYWRSKFKYICIDEVQDTSITEYEIIETLFKDNNILLCGDPFQTIYKWRGSTPEGIFKSYIEKYSPKEIVFNVNYRSTRNLINASYDYLKNAFKTEVKDTYHEDIKAISSEPGEKILLKGFESITEESQFIFNEIKAINPADISKVCILTRNNNYNIELSKEFTNLNVKLPKDERLNFILIDQFKFFRRQEIKDVIAFLKLCANKYDSNSLIRILKRFPMGIGAKTIEVIESKAYKQIGINITDFIDNNTHVYGDRYSMLMDELSKGNIIVFDVESTGVNTTEDEIIQIAAIRLDSEGNVTETFERFLKNNKSVKDSEKVHGFTDKFLSENGEKKEVILKEFLDFSRGCVIVGHNVGFDIAILNSELSRYSLEAPSFLDSFDTLDIYRRFHPNLPNHKLETLSREFKARNKPTHNALDDILSTAELLVRAINEDIQPTAFERQMYIAKHLKAFEEISYRLNEIIYESSNIRPYDLISKIIIDFDFKKIYSKEPEKIFRLREFYVVAKDLDDEKQSNQDSLLELLKTTSLSNGDMERILKKNARIPIITVHQAKGLEFDYVFLSGVQENIFPSYQSIKANDFKEEERVFYVAITRAKKKLYLTYSKHRGGRLQNESRFIRYIPEKYIDKE